MCFFFWQAFKGKRMFATSNGIDNKLARLAKQRARFTGACFLISRLLKMYQYHMSINTT